MKKLLVVFLAMAMIFAFAATALAADTEIPDYSDLADQKAEWQAAVYRLTALGVLEGNNGVGGAFRPADYITRAELAKMVIYLTGNTDKVAYYAAQAPAYTDVADGFWAEGYINAAKDLGLMKGVGYNKFNPQGTVSFQETATVVLRALGYTDALKGEWPADYSRKAAEIDLTDYVDYIGPKAITRAELSSIFNEGLDKLMVSYIADSTAQSIAQVIALSAAQMDWYFGGKDVDGIGVDADGFAYNIFYTNDDDRNTNRDLLYYAFDATAGSVQFWDDSNEEAGPDDKWFSEANAWGYDDFDDGELLLASYDPEDSDYDDGHNYPDSDVAIEDEVASLYYIFGGGLPDLANMLADVTYNEDGEVLFVELTSQKIKVDSWDGDSEDYFCKANGSKLEVGDTKYKVDTEKGYQLNDGPINGDAINASGGYGYLFVDEDGNAYDFKDYYQFADAGHYVFKSLDDNYINFVNGVSWRISKLPDYVIIKDGAFVELEDLEFGDVLYQDYLYFNEEGPGEVRMYIALSPIEGGDLTKAYTGDDFGFTVDDTRYYGYEGFCYYSVDGGDSFNFYHPGPALRDEFFEEEVTYAPAYAWRDFVYVAIDIESYNYGVLTDLNYKAYTQDSNILTGVTIMMADGEEVEYALDDEFFNIFGNNEILWTIGSFVEFNLNKDGEIIIGDFDMPEMWFRYNGDMSGFLPFGKPEFNSRYDWTISQGVSPVAVDVDEDDATIAFDNETYDLAADAEIFVVSTGAYGAYDDCDIVTAEDLLADGDFKAWQIAACYTSGLYGTTIDTLWIIDQDIDDDVKMGYENGGKYKTGESKYWVKVDNTADVAANLDAYLAWNADDFVAYQLDGDKIVAVEMLIDFDTLDLADDTVVGFFTEEAAINGCPYVANGSIGNFTLDGNDDEYSITIGQVNDPDISKGTIKLQGEIYNGSDSETYKYGTASFVFFKDFTDDDYEDMDELEEGDWVVLVRQGAKVLYAFHIVEPDFSFGD